MDMAQILHPTFTTTEQLWCSHQEHTLESDKLMPASADTQSVCETELLSLKSSVYACEFKE